MQITNYILDGFQEYKDEHSLILFTQGCNLNCVHCHNQQVNDDFSPLGEAREILRYNINPLHSAVVILGGEPTVHADLPELCRYIKDRNLKLKIYTNALQPNVMYKCIPFVDEWSIDFKALRNVAEITGSTIKDNQYLDYFSNTLDRLTRQQSTFEIRTTLFPKVEEQVDEMKKYIKEYWGKDIIIQKDIFDNYEKIKTTN